MSIAILGAVVEVDSVVEAMPAASLRVPFAACFWHLQDVVPKRGEPHAQDLIFGPREGNCCKKRIGVAS